MAKTFVELRFAVVEGMAAFNILNLGFFVVSTSPRCSKKRIEARSLLDKNWLWIYNGS